VIATASGNFSTSTRRNLPVFKHGPAWKRPTATFNKYTAKTFEMSDLIDLQDLRYLSQRACEWGMSNRDTASVTTLVS